MSKEVEAEVVRKPPKGPYVAKPKTPAQAKGWEIFKKSVASATDGNGILRALLDFEVADKAQAAFAFNRAKKMFESLGRLKDEFWVRGYGSMGLKKRIFFEEFKLVHLAHLPKLKEIVLTPTASGEKKKHLFQFESAPATILPNSKPVVVNVTGGKKSKKRKAEELAASIDTSQLEKISDGASYNGIIEFEQVRSIKAARLADAMNHPSFQQLSKSQQNAIRQEYTNTLCSVATSVQV